MKTLLAIFSTLILGFSSIHEMPTSNDDVVIDTLTFDGYEGEYAFFTNCSDEAIVLLVPSQGDKLSKKLVQNKVTGNHFQVQYKKTKMDEDTSALGIIINIEPAE